MFSCRTVMTVARAQDDVFTYIADARNRPEWDADVISEELTSGEPVGLGSTVRTRLRSMGRDITYEWVIKEYEPPTRVSIESTAGPFPTTLAFDLAEDEGGTRLTFTMRAEPTGVLRLAEPLIQRTLQAGLDRNFATLKRVLEGQDSGTRA